MEYHKLICDEDLVKSTDKYQVYYFDNSVPRHSSIIRHLLRNTYRNESKIRGIKVNSEQNLIFVQGKSKIYSFTISICPSLCNIVMNSLKSHFKVIFDTNADYVNHDSFEKMRSDLAKSFKYFVDNVMAVNLSDEMRKSFVYKRIHLLQQNTEIIKEMFNTQESYREIHEICKVPLPKCYSEFYPPSQFELYTKSKSISFYDKDSLLVSMRFLNLATDCLEKYKDRKKVIVLLRNEQYQNSRFLQHKISNAYVRDFDYGSIEEIMLIGDYDMCDEAKSFLVKTGFISDQIKVTHFDNF